jgi:hypothetical protein
MADDELNDLLSDTKDATRIDATISVIINSMSEKPVGCGIVCLILLPLT